MHIPQPITELVTASIDTVGNVSSYFAESLLAVSKDMYLLVTSNCQKTLVLESRDGAVVTALALTRAVCALNQR